MTAAKPENGTTSHDSSDVRNDEDGALKSQMERMVGSYDSYMRRITLGRENALREMTVNMAGIKPGDCVLEAGCGTGTLTLAAKRRAGPSGTVYGIDIIPGMIDLSKKKAAQAGSDVAFQPGSIAEIPFPANHFDVVLCSFMIFHMSDMMRRKGIADIHRVLKPRGRLLVLDLALPAHPVSRALIKALLGFMLKHDLRELLPLMEETGFSGIEIVQAGYRVFGLPILSFVRGSKR